MVLIEVGVLTCVGADGRIWVRSGGCDGNVANCKIGKCVGNGISW